MRSSPDKTLLGVPNASDKKAGDREITSELFSAYLNCPYKAHLQAIGKSGTDPNYALMVKSLQREHRTRAIEMHGKSARTTSRDTHNRIDAADLRLGERTIVGGRIQASHFSCEIELLLRTSGASTLGTFHYEPMLCHLEEPFPRSKKLLLGYLAFVLGKIQGIEPEHGRAIIGPGIKNRTIPLVPFREEVRSVVIRLRELAEGLFHVPLLLNNHCPHCEFREPCLDEAKSKDNLSLLSRMRGADIKKFAKQGLFTVNQLSYTYRYRRRPKELQDSPLPYSHALRALAIREQKVYLAGKLLLPDTKIRIYVDMEGGRSSRGIYLIGALVEGSQNDGFRSFWADGDNQEFAILAEFLEFVATFGSPKLLHFGSYETKVFKRFLLEPANRRAYGHLLSTENLINVLSLIYRRVYFPSYSNGLKEIGEYLNCAWSSNDASGLNSIVWRHQWRQSEDPQIRRDLIAYNQEDCIALKAVWDCLENVANGMEPNTGLQSIERLKDADDFHRWGNRNFALDGFSKIIEAAYFDYQHDKIHLRNNQRVRQAHRRKERANVSDQHRAVNKTVWVRARKCAHCKSTNISTRRGNGQEREHSKLCRDLRITPTGIRRWVTRYRTEFHRCNECRRAFVPPAYKRKRQFGHSLISWAVYQHLIRWYLSGTQNRYQSKFSASSERVAFGMSAFRVALKVVQGLLYALCQRARVIQ